jgi:hypothetical protein
LEIRLTTNNYQLSVYAPGFVAMDRVGENPNYARLGTQMSLAGNPNNYNNLLDLYNNKAKFGGDDLRKLISSNYSSKLDSNLNIPDVKDFKKEQENKTLSLPDLIQSCCKN